MMKNKKKISDKKLKSGINRNFENKQNSKTSIFYNLDFLEQHNKLFRNSLFNCGDADTHFKQTLRDYGNFSLKGYHSESNYLKSVKSEDSLVLKRSTDLKSASLPQNTKTAPRKRLKRRKFSINPAFDRRLKQSKKKTKVLLLEDKKPGNLELEVFYSPSNRSLKSSVSSTQTLVNEESFHSVKEAVKKNKSLERRITDVNEHKEKSETVIMGEEGLYSEEEMQESDLGEEEEGDEDKEMKEVEKIIHEASVELAQVAEENQRIFLGDTSGEEEGEGESEAPPAPVATGPAAGDGSFFKFDPAINAAILRELEDAEKQAKETAKKINELKERIQELLKKETQTETEARELEQKNRELKAQMILFEEKTKRIQFLIGQTNLFESMVSPKPVLQAKHTEDILPKVVVCGLTENNIPRLIMCDEKRRKSCRTKTRDIVDMSASVVPKFAQRLNDSYCMQEKLAAENADLEGRRYQLQSDLLHKEQTIECLQRKLCGIQTEMRMICRENCALNDKINQICAYKQQPQQQTCPQQPCPQQPCPQQPCFPQQNQQQDCGAPKKRTPCGKGKGICPADVECRLNAYQETTKNLEQQLHEMESDVKTMQTELTQVQNEREHLESHRKIIICPPICMPHPCGPPPCGSPCPPPCIPPPCESQLRELREQYNRLQDDFKSKVVEVAGLRADNEKMRDCVRDAEELKKMAEDKMKECERTVKQMKLERGQGAGTKEKLIEQEQQLAVAKQRFREAQDELEELRAFIDDQKGQLDDYRNKYLEAQQQVEEQRRQIDMLEMDSSRINEQVNMEIQRVKNTFQEKLQELLPLPDMLKSTQIKLQEAQQMHLLAERNNDALVKELQVYKDKVADITNQLDQLKGDQSMDGDLKAELTSKLEELEAKYADLLDEYDQLSVTLKKTEELADENEHKLNEKLHEIAQLSAQLESVREESARQVARNKERCEAVRRSMQNQISDLERQLVQSRAQAKSAQKDRDEIRQKMQAQINNLHENFEDAQMRIRNLQGHVNFLKESYNTVLPSIGDTESNLSDGHNDPCHCGMQF